MSEIAIHSYSSSWPVEYEAERKAILSIIQIEHLSVHHIGSTSVVNLASKPIIDILIEVPEVELIDNHIQSFESLNYESMGEYGIPGRRYFRKGQKVRSHHIHAFSVNSIGARRHLVFRDYLKFHPNIAKEYQSVKYSAAKDCDGDSEKYCDLKNDFIVYHESMALLWAEKA